MLIGIIRLAFFIKFVKYFLRKLTHTCRVYLQHLTVVCHNAVRLILNVGKLGEHGDAKAVCNIGDNVTLVKRDKLFFKLGRVLCKKTVTHITVGVKVMAAHPAGKAAELGQYHRSVCFFKLYLFKVDVVRLNVGFFCLKPT